jgi:hypothetical protein
MENPVRHIYAILTLAWLAARLLVLVQRLSRVLFAIVQRRITGPALCARLDQLIWDHALLTICAHTIPAWPVSRISAFVLRRITIGLELFVVSRKFLLKKIISMFQLNLIVRFFFILIEKIKECSVSN